jgi:hypothetical protein
VIDLGAGAFPFSKATHFLESNFDSEAKARAHRSGFDLPPESKQWTFYSGVRMPFADKAFGYSICSHVLQMAESPDVLANELVPISPRGYLEFPHPLYDYLFDYDAHRHFVSWVGNEVRWAPKTEAGTAQFSSATAMMRALFEKGHCDFVAAN